jgi:hypothetical protein
MLFFECRGLTYYGAQIGESAAASRHETRSRGRIDAGQNPDDSPNANGKTFQMMLFAAAAHRCDCCSSKMNYNAHGERQGSNESRVLRVRVCSDSPWRTLSIGLRVGRDATAWRFSPCSSLEHVSLGKRWARKSWRG